MILCDTNILIEFYRGNSEIINELQNIGLSDLAISIITAGELYYGAMDKRELGKIQKEGDERLQQLRDQSSSKQHGWQVALETINKELDAIRQEKDHTEKNLSTIKAEKEKELEEEKFQK